MVHVGDELMASLVGCLMRSVELSFQTHGEEKHSECMKPFLRACDILKEDEKDSRLKARLMVATVFSLVTNLAYGSTQQKGASGLMLLATFPLMFRMLQPPSRTA